MDAQSLAVVDLASSNSTELAKKVREACIDTGFFYVINHDIEQELMDEVFSEGRKFFDLPSEKKMQVFRTENFRGYTPEAAETLDLENSKQGDTNEAYYVGWHFSEDDPECAKPLHGPNIWPSEELLPGWKVTMEKYYAKIMVLGHKVASLIALALYLEEDFFKNKFTTPMVTFRLLHSYAVVHLLRKAYLEAEHILTYGLITLLATDSNPGLQICKDRTATPAVWEDVAPMKGAFIVNLGDMLERWTNGLFRSTLHRVLLNGVDRFSVPCFFDPDYDTLVECVPTCQSPANPPKYPPITSGEHLLAKYMETYASSMTQRIEVPEQKDKNGRVGLRTFSGAVVAATVMDGST